MFICILKFLNLSLHLRQNYEETFPHGYFRVEKNKFCNTKEILKELSVTYLDISYSHSAINKK